MDFTWKSTQILNSFSMTSILECVFNAPTHPHKHLCNIGCLGQTCQRCTLVSAGLPLSGPVCVCVNQWKRFISWRQNICLFKNKEPDHSVIMALEPEGDIWKALQDRSFLRNVRNVMHIIWIACSRNSYPECN